MILILSDNYDITTDKVVEWLYHLKIPFLRVNIKKPENFFVVELSKCKLEDKIVLSILNELRGGFCIDYFPMTKSTHKPVQIHEMHDLLRINRDDLPQLRSNLGDITLVLNSFKSSKKLNNTYFQDNSSDIFNLTKNIEEHSIDHLLEKIKYFSVRYINIVGENILLYNKFDELVNRLNKLTSVKTYFIHYIDFVNMINKKINVFENLEKSYSILKIIIDFPLTEGPDIDVVENYLETCGILYEFRFVLKTEKDLVSANEIIANFKLSNHELFPSFKDNYSFFKKNVFLNENDIFYDQNPTRKDIFIKSKVNENFYGKIALMPDGNIYTSTHFKTLGNIDKVDLHDVVFKEISEGSWTLTRNKVLPCKNCSYNSFCPSISNYEMSIKQYNLCNYKVKLKK